MRALVVALLSLSCTRAAPPPAAAPHPEAPTPTAVATDVALVAAATDTPAVPDAGATAATDAVAAPEARPLSYDRALTPADLEGRSLRELAILRNTPYARRGHTFRRPWLRAYFTSQPWYHPEREVRDDALSAVDRANNQALSAYEVALPREALTRARDALLSRDRENHLAPGDDVEAVLLSTRLGERVTLTHGQAVDPETTPLEDPGRLETLLSLRTLRDLSRRDLALLRLLVRARRGRPLQDSTLDQFYSSIAWYHADPTYTDARLTRIDRQNLRLIQTAEAEAGGPLSEADAEFFGGA